VRLALKPQNQIQKGASWRHSFRLIVRLENAAEVFVGAAFVFAEEQVIGGDTEGRSQVADDFEGWLGGPGLVSFSLLDMAANAIGQSLLGEAALFTESGKTQVKIAAGIDTGHEHRIKRGWRGVDQAGVHMVRG
jgi:hypothetical protein